MANKVTTKAKLSASTGWKNILVAATSGTWDLIHTWDVSKMHEVRLRAQNDGTTAIELTLQWLGLATADEIIVTLLPKQGPILITPGRIMEWNATPYEVRAKAGTTNLISITWYIHVLENY